MEWLGLKKLIRGDWIKATNAHNPFFILARPGREVERELEREAERSQAGMRRGGDGDWQLVLSSREMGLGAREGMLLVGG